MATISSQTFTFTSPSQGVAPVTQAGIVSGVPLDGSASVLVPFPNAYLQICNSVVVQYQPTSETDYVVTTQVLSVNVNGFNLVATGGPVGSTGIFNYQAYGI